jgi:DNA primase
MRFAVTLAGQGRFIGVAPLGTSLTDDQAHQLASIGVQLIVATDADLAGRIAAERDYWMLVRYRLDPLYARLFDATDPADLLAIAGPTALTDALAAAEPLAERLRSRVAATDAARTRTSSELPVSMKP